MTSAVPTLPAALEPVLRHMGDLHPYETLLVLLIAFGPFVVIVLLVLRQRRRAVAAEQAVGHPAEELAVRQDPR